MTYEDFLRSRSTGPPLTPAPPSAPAAPMLGMPPEPYVPPQMAGMVPPAMPAMPPAPVPALPVAPPAPTPTPAPASVPTTGAPMQAAPFAAPEWMQQQPGLYADYMGALDRRQGMFAPPPAMAAPGMAAPGAGGPMTQRAVQAGLGAMQREQEFAARFPRAAEAMRRYAGAPQPPGASPRTMMGR